MCVGSGTGGRGVHGFMPQTCVSGAGKVKSSQVKSSQIQNGGRQSASFGAHRWRERSGGQISAQPAPLDSPESGHHPHVLALDHRGAPGLQLRAFFRKSTVRQCNTAPGRRRELSGARARAAPMGQDVGRVWRPPAPRVERARPFSDEFWRFGPDKGTSIIFVARRRAAGAAAAMRSRTCSPSACHTPPTHHISRMRVRARHRCLQYAMGAAAEVLLRRRESSRERRVGDGARRRGRQHSSNRAATTGGGRSERELSSEQREVEGYRPAPSLCCGTGPLSRVWSSRRA